MEVFTISFKSGSFRLRINEDMEEDFISLQKLINGASADCRKALRALRECSKVCIEPLYTALDDAVSNAIEANLCTEFNGDENATGE